MGAGLTLISFAGKKKNFKQTGMARLDTCDLMDLVGCVDNRRDEPEDVSFAWIEPVDNDDNWMLEQVVTEKDLFSPDEILVSLDWIQKLVDAGDSAIRDACAAQSREPYTLAVFQKHFGYDINQIRTLCTQAKARGDRIATFAVP